MHKLSGVMFLLAIAAFGYGGYEWAMARTYGEVSVSEALPVAGPVRAYEKSVFRATVTNSTGRPARVIGAETGCGLQCCFGTKEFDMTPIAPGESREFEFEVRFNGAGESTAATKLYVECNEHMHTLSVRFVATIEAASETSSQE